MAHILIVDDDPEILSTLKDAFLMVGYTVTTALNGIMALTFYNNNNFDLAIIDVDMPVMNGLELTQEIKSKNVNFPVILITGFSHLYKPMDVLNLNVEAFLQKPLHIPQLLKIVQNIT